MLVYSPRWLFLYPGMLLILLGTVLLGWLLPGPKQIGNVTLDIQSAFCSMMVILIGFQAVLFSIMSKFFAINSGLIPEPPRFKKLFRFCNLEVGLIVGFSLAIFGTIGFAAALLLWDSHGFGPLDASKSMRLVIPSLGAVALGSEIILSSFFLTTLGLVESKKDLNVDSESHAERIAHERKAA
jgi:hypothetical protein